MKDRKEIPKFRPINKDAANFLKPLVDCRLTDEEKKHRQATKALEMNCPKSLRGLYVYNEILLNYCKGKIDECDSVLKKLIKAPFPETQKVLQKCREIRGRFQKRKIKITEIRSFLYGCNEQKIIPYDHQFFLKLLNAKHKKFSKQKKLKQIEKVDSIKNTASVADILGKN